MQHWSRLALLVFILTGCSGQQFPTAMRSPTTVAVITPLGVTTVVDVPTLPATTVRPVFQSSAPVATLRATTVPTPQAAPTVVVLPTPTEAVLDLAARTVLFDAVWQTVHDQYLYRDFHGIDWQESRRIFRPRVLAEHTPDDVYADLQAMIDQLHDDHSRFSSPQEANEEQHIADGTEAYVGVGVMIDAVGQDGVITTVFAHSPAADAGLRRRDRVLLVNGQPFNEVDQGLRGPPGSRVTLRIQAPHDRPHDVVVVRGAVNARIVPEAYRLANRNVGYLRIPSFWSETMDQDVAAALPPLLDDGPPLTGLVLDLRGNGGGWRTVLQGLLQTFTAGHVGAFYNQDHTDPVEVVPNSLYGRLATLPIVVLVDHATESYAEVLAASIQHNRHALVVGVQTPGNTETIYAHDFADGSRLWLAQEGFQTAGGTNLEGHGVVPDVALDVPWLEYSEADDPQVQQAVALLSRRNDAGGATP